MLKPGKVRLRFMIAFSILWSISSVSFAAETEIIAERKANFKANAAAMKSIRAALGKDDFDTVVKHAKTIATWANIMTEYFPDGSDTGDTEARAEIWLDFNTFSIRAKNNEEAALTLIKTAKTGDLSETIKALKSVSISCKSCHNQFKE